ncbi:MAG: hypothetical protein QM644_16035 [Mobilitalea sp.]
MNYKSGIWAEKIISMQQPDGSWGCFHTLSQPTKEQPVTTEQALRRLKILGFTKADTPIKKAIQYMETCLQNPEPTVFFEKKHDSKTYGDLMLSTWIRIFDKDNKTALPIAQKWGNIISSAFISGEYEHEKYVAAFEAIIEKKLNPKAGCLANFVVFYQLALTADCFDEKTEAAICDYILMYNKGISYIYDGVLNDLPELFASKQTSRYLAAIELLAGYQRNKPKLQFVVDWLEENKDKNGQWDFGNKAKDGIYFPLSDSWRKDEYRKADCTQRINDLLKLLVD